MGRSDDRRSKGLCRIGIREWCNPAVLNRCASNSRKGNRQPGRYDGNSWMRAQGCAFPVGAAENAVRAMRHGAAGNENRRVGEDGPLESKGQKQNRNDGTALHFLYSTTP
jgi:hypothetical protein